MLLKLGIITGLMGCLALDGDLNVKIAWSFEGDAFLFVKPRSRRLGGFLLCLWFIIFFFVGNYIQTSADDVMISQL